MKNNRIIPLEERLQSLSTNLSNTFPILNVTTSCYFAGAILLSRSTYLLWLYKEEFAGDFHHHNLLYTILRLNYLCYSARILDEQSFVKELYQLLVQPFIEINHTQKEREEINHVNINA